MDIINKIESIIQQNNINQKELTVYLGLNENAFSKWKSGTSKSYLKHISKIAEFLGVSADYLLGNEQKDLNPLAML